jgi:excisionase family DNA binding protein
MSVSFLTNLSEQEFKEFLKEALKEIMGESLKAKDEQLPEILTARQAANFLRLEITTVYEKTSRKMIPHFKRGNRLYFYLSELREWIGQGKVRTREDIEGEAITHTLNNPVYPKENK